ncbi:MAG: DNA alkylation repair protein [Eubacterium sp.]|nr:DNA alkylation repair protein [Eubacterium sp.]
MTLRQQVRKELEQAAQADYQAFQAKLLPGVEGILGVRLPKLREIAKRIAKNDAGIFLEQMQAACQKTELSHINVLPNEDSRQPEPIQGASYEEKMLYGLVIGYADMEAAQYRRWLDAFVPVIDNWGVCDSCCMTYQWMKKQPEYWWGYLQEWLFSDTEFGIRFAFVAMLGHFVDEVYLQRIFAVCGQVRHQGYYARMAQAWLVSMCFVKFPEETYVYLQQDQMDDFTHNKAIQKTCESYRVSNEWKVKIRGIKRARPRR